MVISSGYFIGEIVDSLATIQQQVKNRCAVGLTDMNVHAESFFNTILNHALGTSMVNLNTERSNAPGLDLADPLAGVGFQVTSQSDARKINDTLKAVDGLDERPENIYVLIIGKRQ
jgi:membrane protease subunit (stomatin/prohibitin family)